MKLVTFSAGSPLKRVGTLHDAHVVDLTAAYQDDGRTLAGMLQFLEEGDAAKKFAEAAAASGKYRVDLATVKLLAPIYNPEKIICVGMNYHDHCTEQDFPVPVVPLLFSKFASSIAAPGDPVPLDTDVTEQLGKSATL